MNSGLTPISEQKALLRKQITAERSSLPELVRLQISAEICRQAIDYFEKMLGRQSHNKLIVYSYIPFRSELDIKPVMEWCWQNAVRTAVPRVCPKSRELDFYYITGYGELEPHPPWGILEPRENTPIVDYLEQQGCIILPGLAFDLSRFRLGYGGGFYDKFLARMTNLDVNLHKIALAFDLQIVDYVPLEQHDLPIDRIITETRSF